MDETVMQYLHDMRNRLFELRGLVHYHMSTDKRFEAEDSLQKVCDDLELIYATCLRCRGEGRTP